MKRLAGVTLALVIAVAALWAGQRAYHSHPALQASQRGIQVPAGEAGSPAAGDPAEPWDPAFPPARRIPDQLPPFTLEGRDGRATSIAAWRGKSLIINFWATWCAPCRREMPLLQTLRREWVGRDFEVIGIAVDDREKVLEFAQQFKIAYPLLIGDEDALTVAAALGVASPAFPFTVFTDRRARVVALYLGELHKPEADLILSAVQELNLDRTALATARQRIADGLTVLRARRTI